MVLISQTAQVWLWRIMILICIILSSSILRKELKNRKKKHNDPSQIQNVYEKWLNIWSLVTMILYIIQYISWMIHKIPTICKYNYPFIISVWLLAACTLLMFQTTRLQYCFANKQVHSTQYGYPKCSFIIIYILILLIMIYIASTFWNAIYIDNEGNEGCGMNSTNSTLFITGIGTGSVGICAFIVFLMYAVKACQIKNKFSTNNDSRIVNKINFILRKILLLQTLYYVNVAVTGGFGVITIIFIDDSTLLGGLFASIKLMNSMLLVYLMIENNNDQYIKFMNIVKKCYCCHRPIKTMEISQHMTMPTYNKQGTTANTADNPLPDKIGLGVEQSEMTITAGY